MKKSIAKNLYVGQFKMICCQKSFMKWPFLHFNELQRLQQNASLTVSNTGFPKLHTSIFLIYFWFLKLYFGNQIWKFMYRYFGIFFKKFQYFIFSILWIFFRIKIILQLKSLRTTVLSEGRFQHESVVIYSYILVRQV